MISRIASRFVSTQQNLLRVPFFRFGGGHHHEFNRDDIVLRNERSGYFMDPALVARRVIRVIALHDKITNPEKITLSTPWTDLPIDAIDYVNLIVAVEQEFDIEMDDAEVEGFQTVGDAVNAVAKNFWSI